jgi:hypothetical protein
MKQKKTAGDGVVVGIVRGEAGTSGVNRRREPEMGNDVAEGV